MAHLSKFIFLVLIIGLCWGCKSNGAADALPELDLMSHGLPIKIKAPESAEVKFDDMGIVQDMTIRSGDDFYVQVLAGPAYETDVSKIITKQKADAQNIKFFSKIIEEHPDGFIFEKKYSEDRISYDFRVVRLQGDKEYVFQTGLLGNFSLDDVKTMYQSVSLK